MTESNCPLLAVVQMDVTLGDVERNLARVAEYMREACSRGARIVLFPECCLTGYCFESRDEALATALAPDAPALHHVAKLAQDANCYVVVGYAKRTPDGKLYNACTLYGPEGERLTYHKTHLPSLGLDKVVEPGDGPYRLTEVEGVRVALNICYDVSFPEAARVLALQGADLILLPTNWPPGAELLPVHVVPTRALENNIYYAAANRVGTERGFRFIGQSIICAPDGTVLAMAGTSEETILYAPIDPQKARCKRLVRVPGKHEIDRFADRRPDLYGPLLENP